MVIDYFNGCACARSLGIVVQIKIMGEPLLVFLDLCITRKKLIGGIVIWGVQIFLYATAM
jgi:hypothetical protein